jgi:hypothetical protein
MTDQELRTMIRDSIDRHAGGQAPARPSSGGPDPAAAFNAHASHHRLPLARGGDGDGDGACIIEPAVRCNHCGFCLSFGH